MEGDIRKS